MNIDDHDDKDVDDVSRANPLFSSSKLNIHYLTSYQMQIFTDLATNSCLVYLQ